MPGNIQKRLRLHQDWTNDIPLKNVWVINFSARTGSGAMLSVGQAVEYYVNLYRPKTFKVDKGLIDRVSDFESGFLLAQAVNMPTESFDVQNKQMQQSGGFVPFQIGGNSISQNSVDITFLETNRDIFSFFIQPWIVAASYKGLIEDGENDIKCNIDIAQFSRTAQRYADKVGESNKRSRGNEILEYGLRKMHTFYDCVPTTLEGDQISYGEMTERDITRVTSFNFEYYQLNTPRGILGGFNDF